MLMFSLFFSNKIQFAYHRRKYKYKIPKKLKYDLFQFLNITSLQPVHMHGLFDKRFLNVDGHQNNKLINRKMEINNKMLIENKVD